MSEELVQKNLMERGVVFDNYEFYSIGSTLINSLKQNQIIPNKDYGSYNRLKPDALLVDRNNKDNIQVIAVIEFKKPSDFVTEEQKLKVCKQCNTYCEVLNAKFGIATDKKEYIFINPQVTFENSDIKYNDNEVFTNQSCERSFSYIKREDGYDLCHPFILNKNKAVETKKSLILVSKILSSINEHDSQFQKEEFKNPSSLARSVWQDIWTARGSTPEKALSTFIEIFVFKYLSDLNVLTKKDDGLDVSFNYVFNEIGETSCLKYYTNHVRDYIKELFPESDDGTTLINGMSLSPEDEHQNKVFYKILKKFDEFGYLRNIDPEFKSRLFEDFLKKSISKKNWGQYFTPRNVVKAMVEISGIDKLPDGAKVCDPACGVGGFILESNLNKRLNDYYFEDNELKCKLDYYGFEKGFEPEEILTIILAKANFIIYLSDLLESNPNLTKEFAKLFNKTFKVYTKTMLGSLSEVKFNNYDLIMSNPPYVTAGSAVYKDAINNSNLKDKYKIQATGLEGLFLEKMINELKPGGKGLIVIPSGILERANDAKLRKFILKECILEGIISLPSQTFYTTPTKTYILIITKKLDKNYSQKESVFTYLIHNIGETLDSNRTYIKDNDLNSMVHEFKVFMADKNYFEVNGSSDPLCKIFSIDTFKNNVQEHWTIDKWYPREENPIKFNDIHELLEFYTIEKEELLFKQTEALTNIKKLLNEE